MFQSARLTLTAWYLLIIMLVSITFSIAFYQASTQEIQRFMVKIQYSQGERHEFLFHSPPDAELILAELQHVKNRLQLSLVVVNGIIFLLAGAAGYFLAGRTLRPIKLMVEEQNQFVSNASHELRTPIATLRAEMEGSLLEKHVSDKEARKLIASNLEELSRLQELSNSLLQLTYLHKNGRNNYNEEVPLNSVIQTAYKKVSPIAKKKHITFTLARVPGYIQGDKQSLIEVFVNLFENAIKYSPEKTTITLTSKTEKHTIRLSLIDQGDGIASDDVPHIFERFYRTDKSRSKADGYGLGLSIVKKIVTAHNGIITVTSILGKGTTFVLTFPLA